MLVNGCQAVLVACEVVKRAFDDDALRFLIQTCLLQLVCSKHVTLCGEVLGASAGQAAQALSSICQSFVKATLEGALKVAQQRARNAGIGLELSPASAVIVQLLQSANGLLCELHSDGASAAPAVLPATFCHSTVVTLLTIARTVTDSIALVVCS